MPITSKKKTLEHTFVKFFLTEENEIPYRLETHTFGSLEILIM